MSAQDVGLSPKKKKGGGDSNPAWVRFSEGYDPRRTERAEPLCLLPSQRERERRKEEELRGLGVRWSCASVAGDRRISREERRPRGGRLRSWPAPAEEVGFELGLELLAVVNPAGMIGNGGEERLWKLYGKEEGVGSGGGFGWRPWARMGMGSGRVRVGKGVAGQTHRTEGVSTPFFSVPIERSREVDSTRLWIRVVRRRLLSFGGFRGGRIEGISPEKKKKLGSLCGDWGGGSW